MRSGSITDAVAIRVVSKAPAVRIMAGFQSLKGRERVRITATTPNAIIR